MQRFDGKTFLETGPKGRGYQYHVSGIVCEPDGTKYLSTFYDGIQRFSNNRFEKIYAPQGRNNEQSSALFPAGQDLVTVTPNAIYLFSKRGKSLRKFQVTTDNTLEIRQGLVTPVGTILFCNYGTFLVANRQIIPLSRWLKRPSDSPDQWIAGIYTSSKVMLLDKSFKQLLELQLDKLGNPFFSRIVELSPPGISGKIEHAASGSNTIYLLSDSNDLWSMENGIFRRIVRNHSSPFLDVSNLFVDRNEDLWISSSNGICKVSMELFTSVETSPAVRIPNIMCILEAKDHRLLLNDSQMNFVLTSIDGSLTPRAYAQKLRSVIECPLGLLIGTDEGIYRLERNNTLSKFSIKGYDSERIGFLHWDGEQLWFSPYGKGLVRYNPVTRSCVPYSDLFVLFPDHFYTAQNSDRNNHIYFGGSTGVYSFDKESNHFQRISEFTSLGSYSGVSTKDCYGNMWFTLDKGIGGITSKGEFVLLESDEIFPSTLFYTLTSDNRGHILAGTNKGINILKLDRDGNVINFRNFRQNEGFGGYETNMRGQFQTGNLTYVATIEGLFQINENMLQDFPKPASPLIVTRNGVRKSRFNTGKIQFQFVTILPKSGAIQYSYRISGYSSSWSPFSSESQLLVDDLSSGNYRLEVRSTYDGVHFSDPGVYAFEVTVPVYKSRWFIVLVVLAVAFLNLAYLQLSRTFAPGTLFHTQDVDLSPVLVPRLILLALILNAGMLALADWIYMGEFHSELLNLCVSIFLLILWTIAFLSVRANHKRGALVMLYIAYYVGIGEYFFLSLQSNLHPYGIIGIVIYTSIIPMIFPRLRSAITVSIINILISSVIVNWIESPLYNEVLFILTVVIISGLAVLMTYLRTDSLQKLIFVNGVINKGTVLVISFDKHGIITYASQNIRDFFAIEPDKLIGKSSSILNPFVVSAEMQAMSLRDEFEDGKILTIPMYNRKGEVRIIEWSCKYFDDTVLVILGQDITERELVSANYQNLVENAQDLIYQTDLNGKFKFLNEKTIQVFGIRMESLIGRDALQAIHPDFRNEVFNFYRDQFEHRIGHTYLEFPIKARDGKVMWLGQNVSMLFEPGSRKRVAGFLAVARDITEKRASDLLIAQQNKNITSSINYAKRIQYSLLPEKADFDKYFADSFLLFKPKDIVSGDFYWMEKIDGKLIVVMADCTGHGVPGAFMTILGINLLNQIVRERKIVEPAEILSQLNKELAAVLPTTRDQVVFDGMEAVILSFEADTITWSSSGVPFLYIQDDSFHLLRNEKKMRQLHEVQTSFAQSTIHMKETDVIYLFTDGYPSQFGSLRNKKFSYRRILELVKKAYVEVMPLQRKYFENALRNWSDGHEQTDDITLIGLRGYKSSPRADEVTDREIAENSAEQSDEENDEQDVREVE